jgi:5-methylcytosine-specific restriction endonuclease McrA
MKTSKRQLILDKFGGRCAYCGVLPAGKLQVDHIIPKEYFIRFVQKGNVPQFLKHLTTSDVNHLDNLFPACQPCNFYKSTMGLETFRTELSRIPERIYTKSFALRLAVNYSLVEIPDVEPVVFFFENYEHWIDGENAKAGTYLLL